nr:U32 family peptidase [Tissierella carlieri]
MESLYAAIQNGANAVYLGGKLFNARQYASNFDFDELKEAVDYAHLRDVKVYITANILVDNSEMENVIDYIKFLYEIDVDGIIVQDLGLANLIREFFPSLDVHGSTQMTINNLPGAEFVYDMGFTRVVLARETPIDEIKYIHNNTPIELEAFIHGALCVCYSGQCLMSSLIGGRSGNRGKCAQPCRMPSSLTDKNGDTIRDWNKKHILSPRDLNTLENLEEIIESGIISLKIEGRMKRPEYVATVVKNYRKALDEGTKNLKPEDKKDVEQIFNRGFTKGLTFGDFGRDFITIERPDNRGILVGKVTRADKYNVFILLEEDVNEGDGLEFVTGNGEYKGIKAPFYGKKGTTMKLEKPGYILNDSLVYKTSSINLLNSAKASYQQEKIKRPIDMEININIGDNPKLMIMYRGNMVTALGEGKVEKSERISLTKEKVIEQLSKLGDTTYILNNININLDEGAYLPVSILNLLRRETIEKLDRIVENINHRKPIDEKEYNIKKKSYFKYQGKNMKPDNKISVRVNDIEQFNDLDLEKLDRVYLGFYDGLEKAANKVLNQGKEVYIWTDKILYQKDLDKLGELISPIKKNINGISVSNLGSLKYMQDRFDLNIHGDIGLNIFNSYSLEYLKNIGLGSVTLSPELNLNQIKKINEHSDAFTETIVYGYLPVMVTKHCPMSLVKGCKNDKACGSCQYANGYGLKDRMNITFKMDRRDGFTNIYNSVPLMVLDTLKQIYNSGVSMARLDFTMETKNIRNIQRAFYDYSKGIIDDNSAREFIESFREDTSITNGHYFRGII